MTDILTDQIFAFIKDDVFSFYEIGTYYRRKRNDMKEDESIFESFKWKVTDIDLLKDAVYNRVMILEQSSKSIFIRKLVAIIGEYTNEDLIASVGIEILDRKGIKPKFDKPLDSLGFSLLNDRLKLEYFDLENIDFDFNNELEKLSKPYVERLKLFKEFLIEYSSEFSGGVNLDKKDEKIISNKVFIVHGHNDGIKLEVAQALNKLGLVPIILHEQKSENRTIIEKIEANSDVKFAIVLLTDDDEGKSIKESDLKPRARQNVIFEMGYFIGLLGRKNVCCLINNNKLEKPNDISGIVYINLNGNWIIDLAKELKNCGLDLNMNALI
jgi:hypothetical protein